jgi:MFS family permease
MIESIIEHRKGEAGAVPANASKGDSADQPFAAVVATMIFGTLVFQAISVAPIMLGALVETGRLTNATLGQVATLELLGIAIGSSLGAGFLRAGRTGAKLAVGCLLLAALDCLSAGAHDPTSIAALRGGCGLLEGLTLAAAMVTITYSRSPEKMNGHFLAIASIPQVAVAYLLSSYMIPHWGANSGFLLMAVTALVAAIACAGVRSEERSRFAGIGLQPAGRFSPWAIAALLTILLQNAAIGAGYNYLAEFAVQAGVSSKSIGLAMAGIQVFAVVGAFAVGAAAWRLPQMMMLTAGCLAQAAITFALVLNGGAMWFVVDCSLFGLFWNALIPFGLKLLIELDPSRRLALLNGPTTLAGLGLGPVLVSWLVSDRSVAPALTGAAVLFGVSAALFLAINIASKSARSAEDCVLIANDAGA